MNDEQISTLNLVEYDLDRIVKRAGQDNRNAYYLPISVQLIWADRSRIAALLRLPPSSAHIDTILKSMTSILSILVKIEARDIILNFENLFFSQNGQPRLVDEQLPIRKNIIVRLIDNRNLCDIFHEIQYMFTPWCFSISDEEITTVPSLYRLPFEDEPTPIGSGTYGDVSLVNIAPLYLRHGDTGNFEPKAVVIKKIIRPDSFRNEARNLRVLKKSIRSTKGIMEHIAIIKHGSTEFVMMPFAPLGDLWQFLNGGRGRTADLSYNFSERFPLVNHANMASQLINQCWFLADALAWLHSGITVEEYGVLRCAHMDLKPDNILIDVPVKSEHLVGTWKISDFGLSVTSESEFVTVGDWIERMSAPARTTTTTIKGAYIAPERSIGIDRNQNDAALKSDIWSFGCLLGEILAFAIGMETEVQRFLRMRSTRSGYRGDEFFSEKKSQQLHPRSSFPTKSLEDLQVKDAVLQWLDEVGNLDNKWAYCWAETIKMLLIVDPDGNQQFGLGPRPTAKQVFKMVTHVREHVRNQAHYHDSCTNRKVHPTTNSLNESSLLNSPLLPRNSPDTLFPSRRQSFATNLLSDTRSSHTSSPPISPSNNSFHLHTTNSGEIGQDARQAQRLHSDSPSLVNYASSNEARPSMSSSKPLDYYGVMVNPLVGPRSVTYQEATFFNGLTVTAFSVSEYDQKALAAFLTISSVYVFKVEGRSVLPQGQTIELKPNCKYWKKIAISGKYMACWGFSEKYGKLLDLRDVMSQSMSSTNVAPRGIKTMKCVAVSCQNVFAIVHSRFIQLVRLTPADALDDLTPPRPGEDFLHASFNSEGDLLYTLCSRNDDNYIYIWRIQQPVNTKPDGFSRMGQSQTRLSSATFLVPFNSVPDCMIVRPDLMVQRAIVGGHDGLGERIAMNQMRSMQVFGNHSVISLETTSRMLWQGKSSSSLVEYQINYAGKKTMHVQPTQLCVLKSVKSKEAIFSIFKAPNGIVTAVICDKDGSLEIIIFAP